MKSWLAGIIILSFLGVAVFGFLAMNTKHGEGTLCLANVAKSFGCLQADATFSLVYFHANLFKYFSTAVLLAVLAFLLVLTSGLPSREPPKIPALVGGEVDSAAFQPIFHQQFVTWLALFEKRDPASQTLAAEKLA